MKLIRIVLAVVLTATLLYIARTNSRGRPEHLLMTDNGYTFETTTVPKGVVQEKVTFTVTIDGPLDSTVVPVIRSSKFGQDQSTPIYQYKTTPLMLVDSLTGRYSHEVTAGRKGDRMWYYFEVRDLSGGLRARFIRSDDRPFVLKYVGEVPPWILITHVFFMFATVFFIVLGSLFGIDLIRGATQATSMARSYLWAVLCAFLGGYPIGFLMNWYTFGGVWEGVPFGTDATDNKTQLLFVYLVFVTLASLSSLTRGRFGVDIFSKKALGWAGATGLAVMLGIYLIPHSIQFSPGLTKTVCWSFIGLVAAIYVGGLWRTLKNRPASRRSGNGEDTGR